VKPADLLFSQGFGTRRECAALVALGRLEVEGLGRVDDPAHELDPDGVWFRLQGDAQRWPYREHALLVLHKPAGYECSLKPRHHPSVMALLPAPLRRRGVQPVGRLDEDTTGVLLFTDDGVLLHRLTSPRHHVPKVYQATCRHPVDAAQLERLRAGVLLHDENQVVRASECDATGTHELRLTLTEGKYHQVKRMVAAAGNRVDRLERTAFGQVGLDGLAIGAWRWLDASEIGASRTADAHAARER
jgi:16S rRNA pseudouridine516 synthase